MTARCHGAPGLVPMLCAAAAAYSDRRDAYLVAAGKYCLSKSMYRTCACAGTDSAAARSAVAARAADDVAQRGLLIAPVFVFVCVCVCVCAARAAEVVSQRGLLKKVRAH